MYGGDEVNAVVLDLGTYQVKVGYAGDDTPKHTFTSAVGACAGGEDGADMQVDGQRQFKVGNANMALPQDNMEVISVFKDGALDDWDAVEAIYDHAFRHQLRLVPDQHPLLMAEPSITPRPVREKMVSLLFEKFGAPALFIAKNAVLSSFATGRQSALVVDAGHEQTMVTAVHDGYVLQKSAVRSPIGGATLSRALLNAVQAAGTQVHPRFDFVRVETSPGQFEVKYEPRKVRRADGELHAVAVTDSYRAFALEQVAADVKHAVCRVSDAAFDPEENASIPQVTYELPDGQEIQIGAHRFAIPESLFDPGLLKGYGDCLPAGSATPPVALHTLINDAISRCDVDARRELYANALLVGGTAGFATLRERLERELTAIAPAMARIKVTSPPNAVERRQSVWIGGSVLASLGSFQQMWLSKAEYEEYGPGLIHKKAP